MMKKWTTIIKAINPLTGELKRFGGPNVPAPTKELAEKYCQKNRLGYCHVDGEFIAEISNKGTDDYEDALNN